MPDRSPPQDSSPTQPPSSLQSSPPPRSKRLSDTLRLSLSKFLSLLSNTLDFLSMNSLLFSPADDDDDFFDSDRGLRPYSAASEFDKFDEKLYFVSYRWWSEARESLFGDEVKGVLYATESSGAPSGPVGIGGYDSKSEIVLIMRREDRLQRSECGEVGNYALIAEWMFLRALKWRCDAKEVEGSLAAKDNMQDLFPLHIRLSVLWETNSLVVKISRKDNEIAAFSRASDVFCVDSGLLSIWDFSGQTTQFFTHDRIKSSIIADQLDEEICLELQLYGLSKFMTIEGRKDDMAVEQSAIGGSLHSSSHKMNGSTDHVNSDFKIKRGSPFSSCKEACKLGLTGLYNLGNTCFMNSAIQCLVHTPKLVDYFLGNYRRDINTANPLGMNGELALQFGDLLRKLWTPGAMPISPRAFKSKLAAFAPQFSGYNQHDSQEFLAFLLDGLHEDLNRVKCKPYIETKNAEDRPDEEVAEEYWMNHLARNDSIIVDACQGQYRSTLVCPVCKKLSVMFDPFMYLSLPLPSTTMRTMTLTILSTDGATLPSPVTVTVPKNGRCKDLVQALSTACSLRDDETLLIAEIHNNRILHFLVKPFDSIELICDYDRLVAYRLPKDSESSPLVVFMHELVERCSIDVTPSLKMFGIPLVTRISNLSSGSEIHKEFLKLLKPFFMPVEDSLNDNDDQNSANDDIEMEDVASTILSDGDANSNSGSVDDSHLGHDFQFYTMEERGQLSKGPKIQMNEPLSISVFTRTVNVLVSWPEKMINLYDTFLLSSLPEICKPGLLTKQPRESVSLYKCLEAFLKEEPLGPEDMWYCPNCKKHRQACKKLDLWRLPEILIIHLKRFSYSRFFKNKLETFVDFPIDNFDLSSYIVYKNTQVSHRYKLYAVSNHYGGLGGGHYTAFVEHGRDRWYEFDDSHVSPVSKDQIKKTAAYVLFYRRIADI